MIVTHTGLPGTSPADLSIAGLVPLTTIDWPGRLAASVFLQGCPWKCTYCQNTALLDSTMPGAVPWEAVTSLLDKRQGLLDGVVFTGGEATRQNALLPAILEVRARGYQVGLHTAGCYPRKFERLVRHVDWVGLDIKAAADEYVDVVGYDTGAKPWECLDILLTEVARRETAGEPALDYEVRTTVHPDGPAERNSAQIVEKLRAAGVSTFALQEARAEGTSEDFQAEAASWDRGAWVARLAELVDIVNGAGFERVYLRLQ